MAIGIKLEFSGSMAVLALGVLIASYAAYLDESMGEIGRFNTLFTIGEITFVVGLFLVFTTTYYWMEYMKRKIELMPYD